MPESPHAHSQVHNRHDFLNLQGREVDWQPQGLTTSPSNTLEMKWNADCVPGLIHHHQWPNLTNALAEWEKMDRLQSGVGNQVRMFILIQLHSICIVVYILVMM